MPINHFFRNICQIGDVIDMPDILPIRVTGTLTLTVEFLFPCFETYT